MNHLKPKKPSVFALATPANGLAVDVSTEDVMQLRPDWSHAEASAFLNQHKQIVADAMVKAALVTLVNAMQTGGGDAH